MRAAIIERARGMRANEQAIGRLREIDRLMGDLAEQIDRLETEIEDHDDEARAFREDEAEARQNAEREEAAAQAKRRQMAELQPESERLEAEIESILQSLPDDETAERVFDAVGFQNF